ncbi:MAG: corrinoid protein, partial [Clostridia bacterium]|nr:corrinoid protein [Clostridia bacterium]
AQDILEKALLSAMGVVVEKFKKNEVFVPEVLVCARAMNAGMEILKPYLVSEGVEKKGVAVLGTVKGDLHDIGKNIVKIMLEGKGLEVIDLGVDVPAETFIEKAIEHNAKVICCSALLTTTMGEMQNVVEQAKSAGIRDKVKIMVGGAPITQEFCDSIGADYYTGDGASCADVAVSACKG